MTKRRVVVTGLGMVTPVGLDVSTTWQAILDGQSGVVFLPQFSDEGFTTKIAATLKNFNPELAVPPKEIKKIDTFVQYGAVAAKEALIDSGILNDTAKLDLTRVGVLIGSGIGGLPNIEKTVRTLVASGPRKVSPFFISSVLVNTLSGYVSMQHGFLGPNLATVSACATGTHSIGQAARFIQFGDADVMIAGGAEMTISDLGMAGFAACRALSQRNNEPTKASRPWDKDRDGFVMGEGAGIVVLEEYEHAKARGAKIYAEVTGFGMSSDAHHFTAPHPDALGARLAMQNALKDAKLNPEQIDYINAHATSTPLGDDLEILGIKQAFGDHAYKLSVSSTKSMTGHLLGAAGAIEAIFCILALRDQIMPPTINLDNPSEGCDLDLIPHHAKQKQLKAVLSNSFGFGGTNGALILQKI